MPRPDVRRTVILRTKRCTKWFFRQKFMRRPCVFGISAVRKGSLSGITIALLVQSFDRSLFTQLIAPTGVIVEDQVMPYTLKRMNH